MTDERLKEIKDSFKINYICGGRSVGKTLLSKHLQQELELYNEVIRLRKENGKLKRQLRCKELMVKFFPPGTEFIILTKEEFERNKHEYSMSDQVDY